jgi:HK97 gp10 family phage protein
MPAITGRGKFFKGYIEGGPEMARKLAQIEKGMRDELLKDATLAGAEVIAEEWRQRIRSSVGLGPGIAHYAESIDAESRAGKNGATARVHIDKMATTEGEDEPRMYARRLEFGARGQQAHPMARPAFESSKARALDALAKRLGELLMDAA